MYKGTFRAFAGICLTMTGGLLVQGLGGKGTEMSIDNITGNLLVLCAAASESAFNILSRLSASGQRPDKETLDPLVQTTLVTTVAFLLCLIPAMTERPLARMATLRPEAWIALVWYGVFATALAYLCWYAGIKRSGAFTAAAYSGMMPLTSMLLSAVILGEAEHLSQWLGGALVISGMALIGLGGAGGRASTRCAIKRKKKAGNPL